MTTYFDPDSVLDDWLAEGPTRLSDAALDALLGRLADVPQRGAGLRQRIRWAPRAAYAMAGLAVLLVVAIVAWSAFNSRLPAPVPPAATAPAATAPASRILVCHLGLPSAIVAGIERAQSELGIETQGRAGINNGVLAGFVADGCDLIVGLSSFRHQEILAVAVFENPDQRFALIDHTYYPGTERPNMLRLNVSPGNAARAVYDAIVQVLDGTFRGGTLTDEGLAGVLDPLAQPDGRTNAALLRDGRVLLLDGGRRDMLAVPYAELLDSAAGVVLPTGQPVIQRSNSTVTLLADGRVLVVGGIAGPPDDGGAALASAELWDPASGSFTLTGSMVRGRAHHTATLLADGRVLVVGGRDGDGIYTVSPMANVDSAEIWDPATGLFSPAGSMAAGRSLHSATRLPDGRVLIVGGTGASDVAEAWDPWTSTFSDAGALATPRIFHSATLLPSGDVLVAGGETVGSDPQRLASAEVWDPRRRGFSPAGALAAPRSHHIATLLQDGRVMIHSGFSAATGTQSDHAPEFWAADEQFTLGLPLPAPLRAVVAQVQEDGRVLLVGRPEQMPVMSGGIWTGVFSVPSLTYDPRPDE